MSCYKFSCTKDKVLVAVYYVVSQCVNVQRNHQESCLSVGSGCQSIGLLVDAFGLSSFACA